MKSSLIECVKNKGFGMPTLVGRRLTVWDIITQIFIEANLEIALETYQITIADARAAAEYCLELRCKSDPDRIQFCDGCILRTLDDRRKINGDENMKIPPNVTINKNSEIIYLGWNDELEEEEFGLPGWLRAGDVLKIINDE